MEKDLILKVNNLTKYFPVSSGFIRQKKVAEVKAVDGVSFAVHRGETLGLVGESGCGKTTLGKCVLQLIRPTSGQVLYTDRDLCKLSEKELRPFRKKIQVVFQDPFDSLNPRFTASDIIGEPLRIQGVRDGKPYNERISDILRTVGLAPYMAEVNGSV